MPAGAGLDMPKRVLIVTNRADLHADIVSAKLAAAGGAPFRLNLDEFPKYFGLTLDFAHGHWEGELTHLPSGDALWVHDIGAVWMRKKARFSFLSQDLAPQEWAYAEGEMEHVLFSLLYSLDCYWMSHPVALRGASWKGEQLLRAARMGFRVPPSLVTNRRAGVDAFRARMGGDIVFKPLSSPSLAAEEVPPGERIAGALPTTRITDEHEEALDAVVELPCFFQQHVPKRHELRVTVIGDRVFAARIDSQDDPRTATDYRDFSAEVRYSAERLPPEVERRCLELVRSYGLTYGAIDLIVTPEGEHVFLENNPVGQFLFVEELVPELDMTGALAACLVEGARAWERTA
jgi:glutathione synthase/RimK-type ligase-like ATP-grasp enzyme